MGITSLSAEMMTRGKFVSGNTDTGIVKTKYAPTKARVRVRKMTDLEWRVNQYSETGSGAVRPDSNLIVLALFLLGADPPHRAVCGSSSPVRGQNQRPPPGDLDR